jgi:predicted membrane protein
MGPNDTANANAFRPMRRLIPAIALIGIGALFLLDNFHLLHNLNPFDFWPVILIVIGAVKLTEAPQTGRYTGGAVLIAVGALFLASNMGLLPIDSVWELWPLGLIALGVLLLIERISVGERSVFGADLRGERWRGCFDNMPTDIPGDFKLAAVFSGGKRKLTSNDFRGGIISAVFGGYEIDLRNASIQGPSATIKVDVVFGGVEIKIPETWTVVLQGTGIFGGFSDETRHPVITPETKRLVLTGAAVFGGVVVKN